MRKRWEEILTETEKIHQVSRQMAGGGGLPIEEGWEGLSLDQSEKLLREMRKTYEEN